MAKELTQRQYEALLATAPEPYSWRDMSDYEGVFNEDGTPYVSGLANISLPDIFGADIVAPSGLPYASYYEASTLYNNRQISDEQMREARWLWENSELPTDAPHRYQQQTAQPQQAVKPQTQQQPEQPPYGRSLQEASELYMTDRISGDDYAVARALYDNGFLPAN